MRQIVVLLALWVAQGAFSAELEDDDFIARRWREGEVVMPPAPVEASLREFEAGVSSSNRFYVDLASLSILSEGVVRYVLVVQSANGVRSVSFEGMRCETREQRIYALGRADGSWVKSRNSEWRRIRESAINRQHAALFLEYFCPDGVIVRDVEAIRALFRRGGHSLNRSLY